MECKEGRNHDKTPGYSCINRNIVECKVRIILSCLDCPDCINRNIVECKDVRAWHNLTRCSVLIETLWNVKNACKEFKKYEYEVLIETLWNVKLL